MNIFGGIVRCDLIAEGVVAAAADLGVDGPAGGAPPGQQRRGGERDPRRPRTSTSHPPRRSARPARRWLPRVERGEGLSHGDPLRPEHEAARPGHGPHGPVPRQALAASTARRSWAACTPARAARGSTASRSSTRCIEAQRGHRRNASVVFVPPPGAADAILEAADAGLDLVVLHHRGHPGHRHGCGQARAWRRRLEDAPGRPQLPRRRDPGQCRIGIMPAQITRPGPVGVVSRSGTLTYEAVDQLSRLGHRPVDLRRHRRRPGDRHELHRRPRRCSRTTRRPRPW